MTSDVPDLLTSRRGLVRVLAVLLPVLVGAGLSFLRTGMEPSTAAMVLVLPVVAAAATGDRVSGVLAALTAAAAFDFFFTVPYYSLSIHHRDDLELAMALTVVGLAVTEVALWGRRQQAAALRRDGYIRGLAELLDAPPDAAPHERAATIGAAITEALGADRTEWLDTHPRWNDAVVGPDGRVTTAGRVLPVQRVGLPTDAWTALPVRRGDRVLGHFRVSTATRVVRPSVEQLRVAELLADRMTAVLARVDRTA